MPRGGCHCGKLAVGLATAQPAADLHLRACDCAFCRKHGAAWLSDAAGELVVRARPGDALHAYRQGSGQADFLLCGDCGVLVAVVCEDATGLRGAVNATCLEDAPAVAQARTVSPQRLAAADKRARWLQLWSPARIERG
jgi:hypothetical protein